LSTRPDSRTVVSKLDWTKLLTRALLSSSPLRATTTSMPV